jgi:hypothetical protein
MLLVASAAALLGRCASEDNVAVGLNAACTRTKDCQPGLTCSGGVCSLADAGADGGIDAASLVDTAVEP